MRMKEKTADEVRKEFYAALAADRAAQAKALAAWQAAQDKERAKDRAALAEWQAAQDEARAKDRAALAEWQAAQDQARAAHNQELAEWRAEWKRITGEWGGFMNAEGELVEEEGVAALLRLDELGGMAVVDVRGAFKMWKKGGEYDGVMFFPAAVALVEFKRRVRRADVEKLAAERLPRFSRECPHLVNGHPLYGVVAGVAVDKAAERLAREKGFFVIRLPAKREAEVLNAQARPQPPANPPGK